MNTNSTCRFQVLVCAVPIILLLGACSEDSLVLTCGNGIKDIGETCDGDCPTGCGDGNPCTSDTLYGSADNCNVVCHFEPITICWDGDWCCPQGCGPDTDVDCSPYCGNGKLDTGETCDGDCPTNCNDGNPCTVDILTGSASNCSSACSYEYVTECAGGDGCCPQGCSAKNDGDCSSSCGNGTLESGETCDPPTTCPAGCDDNDPCTRDSLTGSAENCNAVCSHQPLFVCAGGDDCCPAGCNANTDGDCEPFCGNSSLEEGEICDGNCPSQCNDGNPCTVDTMTGSPQTCDAVCSYEPLTDCNDADGCCPAGCNANTDNDCSPSCGNEVIESGETCDPPATCPADCDDGDPCTVDTMTGSAENCNVECSRTTVTQCTDDDGCCLAACNANNDNDCDPHCGNNITEAGETCDGNCPTACDDQDPCTVDILIGSPGDCDVTCTTQPLTECIHNDQCCPSGCNQFTDSDCEVCEPGFHACDTGCCPWEIQSIDNRGVSPSIVIDSNDIPHVAYSCILVLKYARLNGGSWDIQTVDSSGDRAGVYPSMDLDSNDNPHIVAQGKLAGEYIYDIRYAVWNGSSWDIQGIASTPQYVTYSLALDSSDHPHITYYDFDNRNVAYTTSSGSGWDTQFVGGPDELGTFLSIALDSNDGPHLSYLFPNIVDLKYAYLNVDHWEIQTVDSTGRTGWYSSLEMDTDDRPCIAYYDSTSEDLKFARWNGSSWDIQTVDSEGTVGEYASLALDTDGNPHIVYFDGLPDYDLKYARWNGSVWEIWVVEADGETGVYPSLDLDSNNNPHISYTDYGDGTQSVLKYATW